MESARQFHQAIGSTPAFGLSKNGEAGESKLALYSQNATAAVQSPRLARVGVSAGRHHPRPNPGDLGAVFPYLGAQPK
jgi:hypothetical protein